MIIKIGDKDFNFDGYANINEIAKAFDEALNKAYQQGKNDGKADTIEEIIKKIENEISNSSQTRYICEDGEIISTDVGYVEEWFEKYKLKLKDRSK